MEVIRGSLHGVARVLQAAQLHLQLQDAVLLPGCADGDHVLRPTRGPRRCPRRSEQQNRFRNSRERQRIEEKAFRARAGAAQSARQGGTEPGTTRFKRRTQDHRATSPAAGPRSAHGSATAKRARPRKRANLARSKICDFGPELRFEKRNRFRSLRDTRRTKQKVLRKPPAARPVVGQTFKYIY